MVFLREGGGEESGKVVCLYKVTRKVGDSRWALWNQLILLDETGSPILRLFAAMKYVEGGFSFMMSHDSVAVAALLDCDMEGRNLS